MIISECFGKLCRRKDPLFGPEFGLIIRAPRDEKSKDFYASDLLFYDVPFITYIYDGEISEAPLAYEDMIATDWEVK